MEDIAKNRYELEKNCWIYIGVLSTFIAVVAVRILISSLTGKWALECFFTDIVLIGFSVAMTTISLVVEEPKINQFEKIRMIFWSITSGLLCILCYIFYEVKESFGVISRVIEIITIIAEVLFIIYEKSIVEAVLKARYSKEDPA